MILIAAIAAVLLVWCAVSYWFFSQTYAKGHIPDWNPIGIFIMMPAFAAVEIFHLFTIVRDRFSKKR